MKHWMFGAIVAGLALTACATGAAEDSGTETAADPVAPRGEQGGDEAVIDSEFAGHVAAPDFPVGLGWINVPAPLTIEALRGKVVVLDFWTYGCINCIHMIPTIERLEEKYTDELVVIGVHSAKFANEGETENLRQIVQRYDLHHPVINDNAFVVWQTYGANAWPTYAVIDPAGNVFAMQSGEIPYEAFDRIIGGMVEDFDEAGLISREPVEIDLEGAGNIATPLLFPGKVLADAEGERLFIADSNHHRIVVANLNTYEVLDVIGTGTQSLTNGGYEEAGFNKPQGMTLGGNTLYVADTNNHAIRAIDLEAKSVSTIAGTGAQGNGFFPYGEPVGDALEIDLRSPWDVEMGEDDILYIAMAGTHQIWSLTLDDNQLQVAVGNGREALIDLTLGNSELAQPSGLYLTEGELYFADSESSSIRVADFNVDMVRTVAGPLENTLFDFDDIDGPVGTSRLQHPLGVTGGPDGLVYVADTYNSRIKVIDPQNNEITTLLGLGGEGGFRDGGENEAAFDEPGGLDYANGKLYVADTNNHAVRVIDLEANTASTITFPNADVLQVADVMLVGGSSIAGDTATLPEQTVAPGEGEIVIAYTLPDGFTINELIESGATFSSSGDAIQADDLDNPLVIDETEVRVPVTFGEGSGTLTADLTLYYCRYGEQGLCFIDSVVLEAPVTVGTESDASMVELARTVELPELPGLDGF